MAFNGEHDDYFLVKYDDYHGNIGYMDGLVKYLLSHGFVCKAGYWGMDWYFIDIRHKFFLPGRPGVSYGKVIGNHAITFEEFKMIYEIYEKYDGLSVLTFS